MVRGGRVGSGVVKHGKGVVVGGGQGRCVVRGGLVGRGGRVGRGVGGGVGRGVVGGGRVGRT